MAQMTKKEYLVQEYSKYIDGLLSHKMDFYYNPSTARIEPFKIADGLWYVGDKKVCIHLIDTGDGLLLIDSGYVGAEHLLVDSIWRAGFDPQNIRMILHTHGHSDHFGASDEFRRMYGCKLAISRVDAEITKRRADEPLGGVGGAVRPLARMPCFDIELEDGDTVEMGNVKIRCVLTPGHTEGVLSLFFDVTYEGKTYTAGLFGGDGTNALTRPYICKNNSSADCPHQMLDSIEKLRGERVDIHLGNHPGDNHTLEKREKQLEEGGNPFIDPNSWGELLDRLEAKVKCIILQNEEQNRELNALFGE
jgi:metallo-beta-lactamase class B